MNIESLKKLGKKKRELRNDALKTYKADYADHLFQIFLRTSKSTADTQDKTRKPSNNKATKPKKPLTQAEIDISYNIIIKKHIEMLIAIETNNNILHKRSSCNLNLRGKLGSTHDRLWTTRLRVFSPNNPSLMKSLSPISQKTAKTPIFFNCFELPKGLYWCW